MPLPTRDEIIDFLHSHLCYVEFVTAQGKLRKMNCTLYGANLPESNMPEHLRQKYPGTIAIYDLEIKEWRMFRMDRLQLFRVYQLNQTLEYKV